MKNFCGTLLVLVFNVGCMLSTQLDSGFISNEGSVVETPDPNDGLPGDAVDPGSSNPVTPPVVNTLFIYADEMSVRAKKWCAYLLG